MAVGREYKRFDSRLQDAPRTTEIVCVADGGEIGSDGGPEVGDSGKLGGAKTGWEGETFGNVSMVLFMKPRLHHGDTVERQWKHGRHTCNEMRGQAMRLRTLSSWLKRI